MWADVVISWSIDTTLSDDTGGRRGLVFEWEAAMVPRAAVQERSREIFRVAGGRTEMRRFDGDGIHRLAHLVSIREGGGAELGLKLHSHRIFVLRQLAPYHVAMITRSESPVQFSSLVCLRIFCQFSG